MTSLLKLFKLDHSDIRVLDIQGVPWFVGKDVCEYFGDTHYRRSLSRLDEDEKGVTHIQTAGGEQRATIINEPGLYSLLFNFQPQKSTDQESPIIIERIKKIKAFKKWVTSEVLPSIRKTGAYTTDDFIEKTLSDPDYAIAVLTRLKEEREKAQALQTTIQTTTKEH